MSKIIRPNEATGRPIESISIYLDELENWHREQDRVQEGCMLGGVWLRGMATRREDALQPGVYRERFTRLMGYVANEGTEECEAFRIEFERQLLNEFRTAGRTHFNTNDETEIYFTAQHFGMPTRLLDWTANPLTALFFAVQQPDDDDDGEVFVMGADSLHRDPRGRSIRDYVHREFVDILSMRDPIVTSAIAQCFRAGVEPKFEPRILAVRPDNYPGRIGQQSSCFTLHMHESRDVSNVTLARFTVPKAAKLMLLNQLGRLNINLFTIYNDLDNLSKSIRNAWGI